MLDIVDNIDVKKQTDEEYDRYTIKLDPSTVYILNAYKRDCDMSFWTTIDYLLENNLHRLETVEKRGWMDKLWWTIGDDYKLEKQIKNMIPNIDFPIEGKQTATTLKIKTNYFNRINELKTVSYIYSEMSIAKKLALVTSISDFTLPLDLYSVTTMLEPIHGQYVNKIFKPIKAQFENLQTDARRFFYESSNVTIFHYATIEISIEKIDMVNSFIMSTLDEILCRQNDVLIPEEARQMRILIHNIRTIIGDSEILSQYYNAGHQTQKFLIEEKICTALGHLGQMQAYYFGDRQIEQIEQTGQ